MTDKANRVKFFEEIFLVAYASLKVIFGMSFLTLISADIDFLDWDLCWKTYTTEEIFPITRHVELVGKKEFAAAALDLKYETFVVYVVSLNLVPEIHPNRKAQIASLFNEKVKIPEKYSDFTNVFSEEKALVLPERIKLNERAINLEDGKQPSQGPIYSLGPVELENLKTYIKTYLKTRFIWSSKSPASAPILFDKKLDDSFCLCVDYQGLSNLAIKNRYPLPLSKESLDWLSQAKRFPQLDLISAYHQMWIKEDNKWKMAIQTRYGYFKYQVMPFG